jgi:hypothetical protein
MIFNDGSTYSKNAFFISEANVLMIYTALILFSSALVFIYIYYSPSAPLTLTLMDVIPSAVVDSNLDLFFLPDISA